MRLPTLASWLDMSRRRETKPHATSARLHADVLSEHLLHDVGLQRIAGTVMVQPNGWT